MTQRPMFPSAAWILRLTVPALCADSPAVPTGHVSLVYSQFAVAVYESDAGWCFVHSGRAVLFQSGFPMQTNPRNLAVSSQMFILGVPREAPRH